MDQQRPIPTERLRTIRGQMVERFSLDELRDLTFELGADWDQLPGSNKSAKTTELLDLLNRRTQLPLLLERLEALRSGEPWALDDLDESAESPYKGLEYYDEGDAELFFGRERLIATLLDALRGQSLLAVVGASGSGKSSVVRAGVVPVLRGTRPPPEGTAPLKGSAGWDYLVLTPTDRPLEQLALTLTRDLDTVGETRAIIRDLAEDPAALHLYLRKYLERQKKPRAFLLVDQFEELFTLCKDEAARVAFIGGLLAAAEGGSATVVLTLRADFYHHCLRYPGLRDALQQRQLIIGAMDEAELRAAVAEPAARTGYDLEPGLADKIVRDAGDEAGALPLLSHALLETWRRREGRRLTYAGYNDAGGVGGAIARTAERAYGDLDPAQQTVARRIFLQLTELGEGAEDTRRRVGLDDLLPGDGAARREAEAVLHALSRARLVSADDAAAQVSHEALIREWPALQEWLRDNREALRLERRLAAAAAEWDEGRRDPSYLYDGAQLAAAGQWASDNPDNLAPIVRDFLESATAEEKREAAEREAEQQAKLAQAQRLAEEATAREQAQARAARTFRRAAAIVGVLGLAALGLALLAFVQRDNATARLLLNQSERVFESDPILANRLLLEAIDVAGSEAASREAAFALADNLRTGRTTIPITGTSVLDFHGVHTNTLYVVDYQLGKDSLISGATGAPIASLSGSVSSVESVPNSSYFIIDYFNVSDELRQTDNAKQVIPLIGDVVSVDLIPDSHFFIVTYFDEPGELRQTDDASQVFPLKGVVDSLITYTRIPYFVVIYVDNSVELRGADAAEHAVPLNDEARVIEPRTPSPYFIIDNSGATDELRRTDDVRQVIPLTYDATGLESIPDSQFFVVRYFNEAGELRRMDDDNLVIRLTGRVESIYSIPNSPFFVIDYFNGSGELRQVDNAERIITLRGEVVDISVMPNSPFFVVRYTDKPGELHRTDDIEQVVLLSDEISFVRFISDNLILIINYLNEPDELRWGNDFDKIVTLSGEVSDSRFIPNTSFFIVGYSGNTLGELRRIDDPRRIIPLKGRVSIYENIVDSPLFFVDYFDRLGELRRVDDVEHVIPLNHMNSRIQSIPDSPFFVVRYSNLPAELRRTDTGEVVTNDVSGWRLAASADVLNAERGYYRITFQDGTGEIHSGDRALVDLGTGAEQSLYFPETNRVAVRYGDGRVVYIDLNFIEALGGADAATKLAEMPLEDLVARTCDILFIGNPEWDEAKLDEYLAFLPGGRARACGE